MPAADFRNGAKQAPKKKSAAPKFKAVPTPDTQDNHRGIEKANTFKKTPAYAKSIRAAYGAQTPETRHARVQRAEAHRSSPGGTFNGLRVARETREDRIILAEHDRRQRRLAFLGSINTGRNANDIAADVGVGQSYVGRDSTGQIIPHDRHAGHDVHSSGDAYLAELQRDLDKGLGTGRRGRQDLPHELEAFRQRYGNEFDFSPSEPPADTRTGKPQDNYSQALTGDLRQVLGLARQEGASKQRKGGPFGLGSLNPLAPDNVLEGAAQEAVGGFGSVLKGVAKTSPAAKAVISGLPAGAALIAASSSPKIATNAAHDALDFYAQALPSAASIIAHPKQAAEGVLDQLEHPGKSLKEHPLFFPLLLHGGIRSGGRLAGVTLRTAGRAKGLGGLGRVASTQGRAPIVDPLTGSTVRRVYSGDLVAKFGQKAGDRLGRKLEAGATKRRQAEKPEKLRDTLYLKSQAHNMKRNTDYMVGENTRRLNRNELRHEFAKARPRKFGDLVAFINDATVKSAKTMRADLTAEHSRLGVERDKIAAQMEGLTIGPKLTTLRDKLKATDESIARVQNLLDNKHIKRDPAKAFEKADVAAAKFADRQGEIDRLRVQRGDLVAAQAEKSKYINWAVREMGATMDHEARQSEAGAFHESLQGAVKEAEAAHRKAKTKLQTSLRQEAYQRGRTEVQVGHADQAAVRSEPYYKAAARTHFKAVHERSAALKELERLKKENALPALMARARKRVDKAERDLAGTRAVMHTARETAPERLAMLDKKPTRPLANLEAKRAKVLEHERAVKRTANEHVAAKQAAREGFVPKKNRTFIPGLTKDGQPLSVEEVRAEMKAKGVNVDRLAFISSRRFGASAGYVSPNRAPYERRFTLTGATREHTVHSELDALNSQMRGQGVIDALDSRLAVQDYFVKPLTRNPDGSPIYWDAYGKALEAANHEAQRTGHKMVVYRVHDPRLTYKQFEQYKRNLAHTDEEAHALADEHFEASLSPAEGVMDPAKVAAEGGAPNGRFGIMAADVAKQLQAHEQVTSKLTIDRSIQAFTQRWRHAILHGSSFHTWTMGNTAELIFRLAVAGAGPRSMFVGRKILAQLDKALEEGRIDKQAHSRTRAMLLSGGHFTGTQSLVIQDALRDDRGAVLKAVQDLADKPGLKQLRIAWDTWTRGVLAVNRTLEHGGDIAAIGKLALADRESFREFNKTWTDGLTIGKEAAEQVAKRLLETPEQIRYARHVYSVIGNYSTLPPSVRKFIGTYSTFGLWYGNALRFLYFTLPKDHPLVTATLAASYVASEKDRKELGAGMFLGDGKLPDFLQGSVHMGHVNLPFFPDIHEGTYRFNRYLPFGAVGDPSVGANQILPQFEGIQDALRGVDFKESPLLNSKDKKLDAAERFVYALYSTLETMVPFASNARKTLEKGGKPYANSYLFSPKTKKNTQDLSIAGAFGRAFNPLAPVKNSGKKKGSSSSLPSLPGLPPLPGAP